MRRRQNEYETTKKGKKKGLDEIRKERIGKERKGTEEVMRKEELCNVT